LSGWIEQVTEAGVKSDFSNELDDAYLIKNNAVIYLKRQFPVALKDPPH